MFTPEFFGYNSYDPDVIEIVAVEAKKIHRIEDPEVIDLSNQAAPWGVVMFFDFFLDDGFVNV